MDAIIKQAVREELRKQQDKKKEEKSSDKETSAATSDGNGRAVNRLSSLLHRVRNRSGAAGTKRKRPRIDKEHRIQVRWLHYDEGKNKYIPVRNRNGGGNRFIIYTDSDPLNLQQLQDKACELFFTKGENRFGSLQEMTKCITNSAQEVVLSFPGSGTITDYLDENGLYPSLTYFYLRTKCVKSEEVEEDNCIVEIPEENICIDLESDEDILPVVYSPTPTSYPASTQPSSVSILHKSSPPSEALSTISIPEYRVVCPNCFCTNLPGEACFRCKQDEEYNDSLSVDKEKHKEDDTAHSEQSDLETTPVNAEEVRRHRIAYLSRNISTGSQDFSTNQVAENCHTDLTFVNQSTSSAAVSSCDFCPPIPSFNVTVVQDDTGNSSSFGGASSAIAETWVEQQDVQQGHEFSTLPMTSSPLEAKVLKVHRSCVCRDMVSHFQDKTITKHPITFEIIDDKGKPEKGVGTGVARDVFSLFWKAFGDSMTIGERERVPYVRHDHFVNEWQAIGRILVQGYKMVSYFPMFLSRAFLAYCLFGDAIPDSVVMRSFKKYLSADEEELVNNCLSPETSELQSEDVIDFLERFNCRTVLNKNNSHKVVTEIAKQELIQKPHIMISTWQPILSELKQFEPFQSLDNLEMFYERIMPTNKKVLQMLLAQPTTDGERDALKFLQRYIRGLDVGKLGHFLRFTTGADVLIVDNLTISFVKLDGIYKRPVAHTCGPVLELPSTYQDFCELREGFNNILAKSDWEIDIV